MQAEAGEIANDDHRQPDKNEDAIFEFAHPAGKDDLRQERDGGAGHTDRKGDQRCALRSGLRTTIGQHGIQSLRHRTKSGRDGAG
jgi:hypothetical protein